MKKLIILTVSAFLAFSTLLSAGFSKVNAQAQICDDNSPNGKSVMVSAVPSKNSVTLTWTKAPDPVTHYLLAYSRNETDIEFGNPNIGNHDTTTYTVGGLTDGVKYYFKVRPVNGCRPGDFSNKVSAVAGTAYTNAANVKKSATIPPNLSIYKTAEPASTPESVETPVSAPVQGASVRCSTCQSWEILALNGVLLALYFQLAKRNKVLKQIYAVLIPAGMYILFLLANQGCSFKNFSCKYFVPLEIITFIVILIAYKTKHHSFKNSKKSKN